MVHVVAIKDVSDGNDQHVPSDADLKLGDPTPYLNGLARPWLESKGIPVDPNKSMLETISHRLESSLTPSETIYRLNELPKGYRLFEKTRASDPKTTDKYLFGHPNYKHFRSVPEFWPHFSWLMSDCHGQCECIHCSGASGKSGTTRGRKAKGQVTAQTANLSMQPATDPAAHFRSSSSKSNQEHHSGSMPSGSAPLLQSPLVIVGPKASQKAVDAYHTPDRLRQLLMKTSQGSVVDESFSEPGSMDWRSERKLMNQEFLKLSKQASFIPRRGEVVLFVSRLEDGQEICRENATSHYKIYDAKLRAFVGYPQWQAGVVAQDAQEPLAVQDILEETAKQGNVIHSGFRIETQVHGADRSRYYYVPLHHIRPFIFWRLYITGSLEEYHPSVKTCLDRMATWTLVEKNHFRGKSPDACLSAKGIFLGPELLVVGDAVRLKDCHKEDGDNVNYVMKLASIRLEYKLADPEPAIDGPKWTSKIKLEGELFTSCPDRANPKQPLQKSAISTAEASTLPRGCQGFTWFKTYDDKTRVRLDLHLVMGRCYEAEAMILWFPPEDDRLAASPEPLLSIGAEGLREMREHGREHDDRIGQGQRFFWSNSRGEALKLRELNGTPLAEYDADRDEQKIEDMADAAATMTRKRANIPPVPSQPIGNQPLRQSIARGSSVAVASRSRSPLKRASTVDRDGDEIMDDELQQKDDEHSSKRARVETVSDDDLDLSRFKHNAA